MYEISIYISPSMKISLRSNFCVIILYNQNRNRNRIDLSDPMDVVQDNKALQSNQEKD